MCLQKCSLWQIVDARDMKVFLCNAMRTPGDALAGGFKMLQRDKNAKWPGTALTRIHGGGQAKAMGEI